MFCFVLFINLKLQCFFLFEKVICGNLLPRYDVSLYIVPVQVNIGIMFSTACFREHSNLLYTGKPCFDAK